MDEIGVPVYDKNGGLIYNGTKQPITNTPTTITQTNTTSQANTPTTITQTTTTSQTTTVTQNTCNNENEADSCLSEYKCCTSYGSCGSSYD